MRKKLERLKHLEKGGREKKQVPRHAKFNRLILADYFGTSAFSADGVVHEAVPPFFRVLKLHRRFRMSPRMFMHLYHDITDFEIGHDDFKRC